MLKSQIEKWEISGTEQYFDKALEILNTYITYRKKYIIQKGNGYNTVFCTITDYNIKSHLKGIQTYGIFVDKISKFLTFDIDLKVLDKEKSQYKKWVLYKVINCLEQEGLSEYLNISFSGNKGYHIDLIFDKPIKIEVLQEYGKYIIKKYELDKIKFSNKLICEVELRGCTHQGVKLPLGINRKTNKFMYYLNSELKPINQNQFENFKLNILSSDVFYNLYSEIRDDIEINKNQVICNKINKSLKNGNKTDNKELEYDRTELDYVIQNDILKNKGTRNDMIYLVALWCNTNKINKDLALKKLYNIIDNTPKELFNDLTSYKWKCKECRNVIEKVYENNLVLFDCKNVGLNSDILEWIMSNCKTIKQMNIFLCHVYHCIKWGNSDGIYFLSENRICQYTDTKKRDTVINLNKQLIDLRILKVVEKGKYIDLGNGIKKGIATTYKLTIPKEFKNDIEFYIKNDKINFIKMCHKHLKKENILAYIPLRTYRRYFKIK
ncbi:TOTE conflict system archaeo-eukaryotic primase domain-containing protein [Clostridium perfringens]|uniref:TOTE conflict system archaeo-eukaryotic primase domain-containing protein n=1 Tax=Clostridium perfringens TaxID=1502 RepID=UPI003A0FD558